MKIIITEDTLLESVQAGFNYFFPSYRLEFFRVQPDPCVPAHLLEPKQRVGDVTYDLQEGTINLNNGLKVAELEEIFNDRFGLHIYVFSNADNSPIAMPIPGNCTLRQSCN
jgi:hypothetical protein